MVGLENTFACGNGTHGLADPFSVSVFLIEDIEGLAIVDRVDIYRDGDWLGEAQFSVRDTDFDCGSGAGEGLPDFRRFVLRNEVLEVEVSGVGVGDFGGGRN